MKVLKEKKRRKSIVLRIALFAFAAYVVSILVHQQLEISERSRRLEEVNSQLQVQEMKNEDLKHALSQGAEDNSDYIERVARDELNYAKPGERVFVNIAGD